MYSFSETHGDSQIRTIGRKNQSSIIFTEQRNQDRQLAQQAGTPVTFTVLRCCPLTLLASLSRRVLVRKCQYMKCEPASGYVARKQQTVARGPRWRYRELSGQAFHRRLTHVSPEGNHRGEDHKHLRGGTRAGGGVGRRSASR